jgi:aminoglycoside 6'-N-acetyltransferase
MSIDGDSQFVLRQLEPADEAALRRIREHPDVLTWWDEPSDRFLALEPNITRWTILWRGQVAGLIEVHEELAPKYKHAEVDVFLDPEIRGRGVGAEAVRRVVCELIDERGHHRVTIDPAVANRAAIRAYEKVGFRPVGVMRAYERDTGAESWHDALLMDLLAGEEQREPLLRLD